MADSATVCHGRKRHNQPNRHAAYSPPSTLSLSHYTIEALHQSSCDLFSPSPLRYEGAALSSPMAYDYASQTHEFLEKKNHRPSSAGCTPSAWTSVATLSPPFSDSKSAVLIHNGSTSDCGSTVLRSVSTPSIGFDDSTSASTLSFPSPALFSGELSSIHQSHSASDLACCTPLAPSFQHPLLSSTSSDESSIPWPHHNLSVNSLSGAPLSSSNSMLALSDPAPSGSSSRSWTPDQIDSFNTPTGRPEFHNLNYHLPPIGSQTPTEELAASFGSNQRKSHFSSPKHDAARFFPQRLLINPTDTSTRGVPTSLSSQLSPFCGDAESATPCPTFSSNGTHLRSHLNDTVPLLCSSLRPLAGSPMGPELMNRAPSLGIPPTWFQSSHFSHVDANQSLSEYYSNSNPRTFLSSQNSSSLGDSFPQPSQDLNTQSLARSVSPTQFPPPLVSSNFILEKNDDSGCSLSGASGRALITPISNRNAQHTIKCYKKKKREVREIDATCGVCGNRMAQLILRGSPEELYVADGFELVHTCKLCQEGRPRGSSLVVSPISVPAPFSSRSFVNTSQCQQPESLYSKPIPHSTMTIFRKRNRRTDDVTAPTTCDCCARQLGVGGIVPRNGRSAIQFVVEVVCVYCINNFRRCTDCGGGGGSRLGVGKWRCKELFSEGRRTCILSHQRQGASTEVITQVWKVKDLLDKPELETLVGQVRELVKHSLYAALATPEMLESGLARVSRFDDIKTMYANGWKQVEPLIREDVESSSGTSGRRRYVGLRWTKPHPRKSPKRVNAVPDDCSPGISSSAQKNTVLQSGKELSAFVLSEWDMHLGTFFVSVAMPWQSGDALELTTGLANKCFIEAKSDRERLIDDMVHQGMSHQEAVIRYPPIHHLWTFLFFHRDARLVQFLEKRRKFMPLEEYLSQYPDARRDFFPPERDCYIPTVQQQGWNVWVRREDGSRAATQT